MLNRICLGQTFDYVDFVIESVTEREREREKEENYKLRRR
jgi:hypothetical protein